MRAIITAASAMTFALPLFVSASQVQISATAYSSDECQYYSTSLADVKVGLVSGAPWGSRVVLRYGFHDAFSKTDWVAPSQSEMVATAPYTWTAWLKGVQVDARGDSYYDEFQFDFEVISADGPLTYDNGGSSYGFYQAALPSRNCQPGILELLALVIIDQ